MSKKILKIVTAVILVLLVLGLILPQTYNVSHSVVIAAEPGQVHALVGDLKAWPKWEPFSTQDATMVTTIGDKSSGVGASQQWTGKGGSGHLTFTKCDPKEGIAYDMAFVEGGKETPAQSSMTYTPKNGGTEVTWNMKGSMDMPVVGGYFALMSDMMIGPMFDQGLEKLKKVAEAK